MTITPAIERWAKEKSKLTDQQIVDPDFASSKVTVLPWTPYYRTNNFVQNTLARLMTWDTDNAEWRPLKGDTVGAVKVSASITDPAAFSLISRRAIINTLASNVSVPSPGIITHTGIDVQTMSQKTLLVSADGAITVYVQFSNDNT